MIRRLFIFFFLAVFSFNIYAQDSRVAQIIDNIRENFSLNTNEEKSRAYQSRWQARFLAGTNIPITRLLQGAETDYLLNFDDSSFYWQILSVSYFFHRHWGVEFSFQPMTSSRLRKNNRADNFMAYIQSIYGENYYISRRTNTNFDNFNFFGGDFNRGFLGIVYRFETDRFYVYPRFAIGLTSFRSVWSGADLKRKNSNIEYRIRYSAGEQVWQWHEPFTFAPSVSFGYKLSNRFFLNADIMFSHFRSNIVFERTKTNLFTNESTIQHFDYRRGVSSLSLGAGLIFVIR